MGLGEPDQSDWSFICFSCFFYPTNKRQI